MKVNKSRPGIFSCERHFACQLTSDVSMSLGPRDVMKTNKRSCGSENKKDLGEDTSRGKITKEGRSGDIVVGR